MVTQPALSANQRPLSMSKMRKTADQPEDQCVRKRMEGSKEAWLAWQACSKIPEARATLAVAGLGCWAGGGLGAWVAAPGLITTDLSAACGRRADDSALTSCALSAGPLSWTLYVCGTCAAGSDKKCPDVTKVAWWPQTFTSSRALASRASHASQDWFMTSMQVPPAWILRWHKVRGTLLPGREKQ